MDIMLGFALIDEDGVLSWDDMTTDEENLEPNNLPNKLPCRQKNTLEDTVEADKDRETIVEHYYDIFCDKYLDFTDENPTTFHVVHYFRSLLDNNGFQYIDEQLPITKDLAAKINNGGFFYTIRGGLTILPFIIGGKWAPESGAGIVGSHIDAITNKLKPTSIKPDIEGYNMLGVAGYSSGLKPAWLDRDLGIGGNIIVQNDDGTFKRVLVKSPIPIAKIPSLAPHFHHSTHYNPETEMVPIVGYTEGTESETEAQQQEQFSSSHPLAKRHLFKLLKYLAQISHVAIDDIVELELELFDVEPATRGGLDSEFIFAPRLDDRLCSFAAVYALIEVSKQFFLDRSIEDYDGLNMVLLVDNEEIGSGTRTGVKGKLLNSTMDKLLSIKQHPTSVNSLVYSNSIILSADVTHLLNPNFKSAYLAKHSPLPNIGMTVKLDPNGHVMSDYVGYNLLRTITGNNGLQIQQFHIRNDGRSGGTIGPQLAIDTGARVIDIGLPILSMHSIRAMCGYKEVGLGTKFFKAFFNDWRREYSNYRGL